MDYRFYFLLILFLIVSCNDNSLDYDKIVSFQDNSIKELKISVDENTRVLLVFPHADDEITCVGLATYLKSQGAKIHMLTLGHNSETKINETRIEELNCSANTMGVEKLEIAGLIVNKWDDIMKDNISFWYDKKDSIKAIISNKIERYKPQILVTYDTEIGGYGHPEHRISAQLTEELFHEKKTDSLCSLEKIYQFSLPDKLENFMLSNIPAYDYSKSLTNSKGLPDPDVALNITEYWKMKNDVAGCHKSQFKILNKFYMIAKKGELDNHSMAFSKEYYNVIE